MQKHSNGISFDWTRDGGNFQPLSHSATLPEWPTQPLWLQPLWQSGWVAEWLRQSHRPMDKVFKHFNAQARLYDIDSSLIYKHNPVNFNCHSYISFNVLIKNSRIYALNYNLKSLKRKESVDELYKFRIGDNYYINNREEPLKYKMIDGIDDVIV